MTAALILFLVPTLLFVVAFLYETFISFRRLKNPKAKGDGYVSATWEVTHTLLVAGVVMLVMMFTSVLDGLSSAIFVATFLAAVALGIRAVLYIYIFYVRNSKKRDWLDWSFAITHIFAAVLLVIVVLQALWFLYKNNPPANTQFLPYFIPGMIFILAICIVPIVVLYKTKD